MKYVITGSLGHISKQIVTALVKAGHDVTTITSNKDRVADITALGSKAAVGSLEDLAFLTEAFSGADAVYTMVPPNFTATDWKAYIEQIGKNYTAAIKSNNIKYVVNLSSVGAHRPDGCGPVSGLYRAEQALNTLKDVNIKHLRPSYFYNNLFGSLGLIKSLDIMGSNFSLPSKGFPIADTSDIAAVAIEELSKLKFTAHSVRYIASDETGTDDIAAEIGKAVGKPQLKWIVFPGDQALAGMLQAGLSQEIAANYVEMGEGLNNGIMLEDYWKNRPGTLGKVKLADFGKIFAAAYNAS